MANFTYLFHITDFKLVFFWEINSNICLSLYKMRQLLALDNNRKWKTDYGPARGSNFGFVMCSGQVTVNLIPHRQATDEKLTRKNTEKSGSEIL